MGFGKVSSNGGWPDIVQWGGAADMKSPHSRNPQVALLVEIFHRLLSASQAEIGSFSLQVIGLPSAEAHPSRKLELDVVRLFGAGSKELKAIGRVKKEGVGIRFIRCQNCLESVQL